MVSIDLYVFFTFNWTYPDFILTSSNILFGNLTHALCALVCTKAGTSTPWQVVRTTALADPVLQSAAVSVRTWLAEDRKKTG